MAGELEMERNMQQQNLYNSHEVLSSALEGNQNVLDSLLDELIELQVAQQQSEEVIQMTQRELHHLKCTHNTTLEQVRRFELLPCILVLI